MVWGLANSTCQARRKEHSRILGTELDRVKSGAQHTETAWREASADKQEDGRHRDSKTTSSSDHSLA